MRRAASSTALLLAAWGLLAAIVAPARGQDFAAPLGRAVGVSAHALLEHGRSRPAPPFLLETAWVSRYAMSELTTRAVALAIGSDSWTGVVGISQTGDRALGWSAAGAALGFASDSRGVALRGVARREPHGFASVLGAGIGVEAGGAAWIEAADAVTLWASAPQLWTRGAPPPLKRALELGASWRVAGLELWLARHAPVHLNRRDGDHEVGAAVTSGPWRLWFQARDHPVRGGLGVAAAARRMRFAGVVESHPVLGETVTFSLAVLPGSRP